MTILQLTYLLVLSKTGSFSEGAKQLDISQPALSMQIAKLEEELGVKLFHRAPTRIRLTSEGEKFVERVAEVLQSFERLKNFPVDLENRPAGSLKIGIIPTLSPYWLPLFIGNFTQEYPNIKLTINEMITRDIIVGLKTGTIDAGFLSTPVETAGIDFRSLFYEQFFLYVSESHSLAQADEVDLSEIVLDQIWYLDEGNCFQNQVASVCQFQKEADDRQALVYRSNSIESLCRMVEAGKGITFMPELATMSIPSDREEMIKALVPPVPVREISLATVHHQQPNYLVELLLKTALKAIPQRMKKRPVAGLLSTHISVQ